MIEVSCWVSWNASKNSRYILSVKITVNQCACYTPTLNSDSSCSAMALGFSLILAKLSLKSSPCLGLSFSVDNCEQGKQFNRKNVKKTFDSIL